MSPTAPAPEAALARVSVVSAATEAPRLPDAAEEIAAGTCPGATLGERLNAAVAAATGDLVLFVGEGVTLRPGAVEALLGRLASDPSVAAVCGKLVAAGGRLIEAGGIVWGDGTTEPYGRGEDAAAPSFAYSRIVDYGSVRCLLVRRDGLPAFDERLDSPGLLGADLCLSLADAGGVVRYEPRAEATVAVGRVPVVADRSGLALSPGTLERLRPTLVGPEPQHPPRRRVLVVGVYLADRLSTVADVVATLTSERHDVVHRWVALGGEPASAELAAVTAEVVLRRAPKYALLNRLLAAEALESFDEVLVTDDDVVFPHGFLDRYLALKEASGFALAQPARTPRSYIDHPIVGQQPSALARRTQFVEIGPVLSVHRSIYDLVFPHDERNEMGWGYEQVWAQLLRDRGIPMGIVDATPVDHSVRKPAEHYEHARASMQREAYLAANPHLELDECFRVLEVTCVPEESS